MKKIVFAIAVLCMAALLIKPVSAKEDYGSYLVFSYAINDGDIKGASSYLSTFIKENPNDTTNMRRAYMVMGMAGNLEDAATYAVQDTGEDREKIADLIIAINEGYKGNYDKAIVAIDDFSKDNVAIEIISGFFKSWFLVGQNKYKEALQTLEKAKSEPDLRGMYHLHQGMIYEISGDKANAMASYEKALLQNNRISPKGLKIIARLFIENGKKDEIINVLNNISNGKRTTFMYDYNDYVLDGISNSLQSVNDGLAEAFFGMGSLFLQAKSNELAELLYSSSLKFAPDFYSLRLMFGELYEQAKDYNSASKVYGEFSLDTPFGLTALTKKVIMMASKDKEDEEAQETSKEALLFMAQKFPENISLLMNYADFLRGAEEYEEAIVYYTKIINKLKDADGEIPDQDWFIVYSRGVCYERSGDWEMAEKDLLYALELSNDNPYILNYLGYSWLDMDMNKDEAMEMLETAYDKMPYDGHIADSLGWGYYMTGDYENAKEMLERALDTIPDNSVVLDHLGDVYWKVGRKIEAEFQWKKALQMNKDLEKDDPEKIKYKIENGLDEFEKNYKND